MYSQSLQPGNIDEGFVVDLGDFILLQIPENIQMISLRTV